MLRISWILSGCAATARLRPIHRNCYSERRQRTCDVPSTERYAEMCGNAVAAHSPDHGSTGSRDEAEQSHSAHVHREATSRDRTSLCPHGHGSMMMQATPQQSLYRECSTCSTTSGLSLDGCDVRLVDRGNFEGAANVVPIEDDETPCL